MKYVVIGVVMILVAVVLHQGFVGPMLQQHYQQSQSFVYQLTTAQSPEFQRVIASMQLANTGLWILGILGVVVTAWGMVSHVRIPGKIQASGSED